MKVTDEDLRVLFSIANRDDLTDEEYHSTKAQLLRIRSETDLGEAKKYGSRIAAALMALEHHRPQEFSWYQKPLGLIFIAGVGGVLTYSILLLLGWVTMPN